MSALQIFNLVVNAVVIAGCSWCLWSPLPRKILRNGRTPILHMIRIFALVLLTQSAVRIAIEVFEPSMTAREVLRLTVGLISVAAVIALVRFTIWIIEQALREEETIS